MPEERYEDTDADEVATEISAFQESEIDSLGGLEEVEEKLVRPPLGVKARRPSVLDDDAMEVKHGRRLSVAVSAAMLRNDTIKGDAWKEANWEDEVAEDSDLELTARHAPDGTVLFFDWDDTLLPTSAVCQGGWSGTPPEEAVAALRVHAEIVRDLLHAARSLGRIGIVTLAQRPWVQFTAERYLLGIDWEKEFSELGIPIIYAREALPKTIRERAMKEEGVNLYVTSKTKAMAKALKKLKLLGGGQALNVISIGDSAVELEAAREVVWSQDEDNQCKTVKLRKEPSTVEELSGELREVMSWIRHMICFEDDFDIELDKANDPDSPLRRATLKGMSASVAC
mmetsp:Transcript_102175/g.298006  ORF Transcript_102175/g.298006 Transcript_102175/m.298006 type:complete len:341 (-) Transcript_102175:123-1145(-)